MCIGICIGMCIGMCTIIVSACVSASVIWKTSIDPTFETSVRSDTIPIEKNYKKSRTELSKTHMKKSDRPMLCEYKFRIGKADIFFVVFLIGILSDPTLVSMWDLD